MVQSVYVSWLNLKSLKVIRFSVFKIANFIVAECSIVEGFEVVSIDLDSCGIVEDRLIEVFLLTVGEASVMVEISFVRLEGNGNSKVLDSFIILVLSI